MLVDIGSQPIFALTPECLFCPSVGMYDQSYSSSAQFNTSQMYFGDLSLGGIRGTETVTFGGLLQDVNTPIVFINQMSTDFRPRMVGGHLGLFVSQLNQSRRAQSVLVRLDEQGQLLNPVWGMRLGGKNPQVTIGALDPNDYEGDINWVPAVGDQPVISVDALKGYQGNVIPANYPLNATIDSSSGKNIYLPELDVFMMNTSYVGPQEIINIYPPDNKTFGVLCNGTKFPTVDFSVEINGVDYPVTQPDLIRKPNFFTSANGFCNVGIMESSLGEYVLGITFLRSVYLAYRFPTGSCPGYWGFATPKGVDLPTPTNRKPKATPTDASTCLAFTRPSSTPTPTIKSENGGFTGEKYAVLDDPTMRR
ncbi:aspartyl protease [Ceratobasidium sp. AG-Ba]|nr:aspartyl protease [Ceratobasidium sp. AG-Ba]